MQIVSFFMCNGILSSHSNIHASIGVYIVFYICVANSVLHLLCSV